MAYFSRDNFRPEAFFMLRRYDECPATLVHTLILFVCIFLENSVYKVESSFRPF